MVPLAGPTKRLTALLYGWLPCFSLFWPMKSAESEGCAGRWGLRADAQRGKAVLTEEVAFLVEAEAAKCLKSQTVAKGAERSATTPLAECAMYAMWRRKRKKRLSQGSIEPKAQAAAPSSAKVSLPHSLPVCSPQGATPWLGSGLSPSTQICRSGILLRLDLPPQGSSFGLGSESLKKGHQIQPWLTPKVCIFCLDIVIVVGLAHSAAVVGV